MGSNRSWDSLRTNHDLFFGDYGDVTSTLFNANNAGTIIIQFFDDLITNDEKITTVQQASLENYLQIIKSNLQQNDGPLIYCFGRAKTNNLIEGVKQDSEEMLIYEWYLEKLKTLRDSFLNFYLLDLNEIFGQTGISNAYSSRNWYFGRCRLSLDGLGTLVDSLETVLFRLVTPPKKVLILDCDNTIWGGVIGEDGLEGLCLGQDGVGQAYSDFQREVVNLVQNGIILALASKNNEKDVWQVFDNHSEMIIKRKHIVASQINWEEKALNVQKIAENLDLNVNSFVFWDDNPLERDKMRTLMPEVETIEPPKQVIEWPNFLRGLNHFAKFNVTEEDKKKVSQYKARAQFIDAIDGVKDLKSYLSSLELKPTKMILDKSNISRASQMSLKTNQFNFRTKRYTESDLQVMDRSDEHELFVVRLQDVHGDHGIIALVCLKVVTNDVLFIDTFLMSCRVLGRHLEAWILTEILNYAQRIGKSHVLLEYIDTGRNSVVQKFIKENNFSELENPYILGIRDSEFIQNFEGELFLIQTTTKIVNADIYGG